MNYCLIECYMVAMLSVFNVPTCLVQAPVDDLDGLLDLGVMAQSWRTVVVFQLGARGRIGADCRGFSPSDLALGNLT